MLITTVLTYFVLRRAWRYPLWISLPATLFFASIDAVLVAACATKFFEGGWFPVVLAALLLVLMAAWHLGREELGRTLKAEMLPLPDFVAHQAGETNVVRVDRTAVFLSGETGIVPQALLHNMKHNLVLHRRNILLTVVFHEEPWVPVERRVEIQSLGHGFWQVVMNFGFMDRPDVPAGLALCGRHGLDIDMFATSFFLSRETVVPRRGTAGMANWRQNLFEAMSRNAGRAVEFFGIPSNAVIELGTRVQL
jgi:KUP system potassium uptake protein